VRRVELPRKYGRQALSAGRIEAQREIQIQLFFRFVCLFGQKLFRYAYHPSG
jgi:hypothetical protein